MTIFIEPDELKSSSLLPELDNAVECPGLEQLTGADMVLSRLPVSPVDALPVHIVRHSFFIQRKSGYDILSFDNLKHSIARMQKCRIPMPQAILLFIGRDWQDDTGKLRIENSKPYGDTTYKTFLKLKAKWRYRGGIIDWIKDESQLPLWIEAQLEALEDIEDEGKREVYPVRPVPMFEPDDIWQEVVEVDRNVWRYFLCAGLDGYGPTLANNTQEYIRDNINHLLGSGLYAIKTLTDENEKGKPEHKIKGFGDKSRQKFRQLLGLPKGYNLSIQEIGLSELGRYADGWYGALRSFKDMVENEHSAKDSFNALMRQCNEFFREEVE